MARIEPLPPPYEPPVAEDLAKLMPPGMDPIALFRTLAHNPRVLRRVRKGGLLDRGSISLREREIVILRTTALCRSEYEWGVHVAFFSAAAELTRDQIAATVSGDASAFPEHERALLALCDALHRSASVDDALWQRLVPRRPDQLIELVALAGQYHTISYLTNALAIAREPGAPKFETPQGQLRDPEKVRTCKS
jgi:alkylhydroperoxidase family enzyme